MRHKVDYDLMALGLSYGGDLTKPIPSAKINGDTDARCYGDEPEGGGDRGGTNKERDPILDPYNYRFLAKHKRDQVCYGHSLL